MPVWSGGDERGDYVSSARWPDEHYDQAEVTPPDRLEANRWATLGEIVRYAGSSLPFYQRHWARTDLGIAGHREGFQHIPRVRKSDLIQEMQTNRSMRIGIEATGEGTPSNIVLTSGTSGFYTFAALSDDNITGGGILAQLRELWAMRVRPGMRVLSISPAWHALGMFETRALTELGAVPVMPWGTLTPRFVGNIFDAIRLLQPEHLLVTARAARMLLAECDRRRLDSRRAFAGVRYLGCAGEPLSSPFRHHLRERFDLEDLFERGGSGDGMFGGSECFAHRGHHVSADVHYVEIVSPAGDVLAPGERGSAVVTNLGLGRSLYIRFDTEDIAAVIPGDCPCGRTQPVIEFYGRLEDSVTVESRLITPADVRAALDGVAPVRFAPFSLEADGNLVRIAVQGVDRLPPAAREEAAERIARDLDAEVTLEPAILSGTGWKEARVRRHAGRE
jgi:phenylacetate-coenzyme A ligase PaaK-like adenylate-forming protein